MPKLGSVQISLVNLSPELLDPSFEQTVKTQCERGLRKLGYSLSDKQPNYNLIVSLKVDSSLSHGFAFWVNGSQYPYSRLSKGIMLNMEAYNNKQKRKSWENQYDLYYFGDYSRDLKRTRGVVSYMISSFNKE